MECFHFKKWEVSTTESHQQAKICKIYAGEHLKSLAADKEMFLTN